MQDIILTISKSKVWNEIAKATSYTGAKMVTGEDPGAYNRIFVSDEEREMMERFWVEACSLVTSQLREWVKTVNAQPIHHGVDVTTDYILRLNIADAWPTSLQDSVQSSLLSFVVATILSKWYRLTNKAETEAYANEAAAHLTDAELKLYQRKRPTRP